MVAVVLGFTGILLALGPDADDLTCWTLLLVLAGALDGQGNFMTREWCAGEGTAAMLGGLFGMMLF